MRSSLPKCLHCGKPLGRNWSSWGRWNKDPAPVVGASTPWGTIIEVRPVACSIDDSACKFWTGQFGRYGDGMFCGLNCGYRWAVAHAAKQNIKETRR